MVVWLGAKSKARLVPDGQFEKRRCPECGKTTVFREAVVKREYSAWVVVKLWESEATKFVCEKCGSVMDLEDTLDPELSAAEKQKLALLEAKQAAIEEKKQRLEQVKREAAQRQRKQDIDDELAAMKKKLGLD